MSGVHDALLEAAAQGFVAGNSDGGDSSGTPHIKFQSAAEIAKSSPPKPLWVAPPWVCLGAITELVGKIKASGKTTFTAAMCRKILDGQDFLGKPTMRTPIVFLTEQGQSSFYEALRRADLLGREDFSVLFFHDTIGASWHEVVEAAYQEMRRQRGKLLVVDTLPQFAKLRGDAENNSGQALEAIEPLQQLASYGNAVWVNRHERKGGGAIGESARGSSAFSGVVDIILTLRRGEGNSPPTVRVINSLSRFDETPDELVIDLQDGEYLPLGDAKQVALTAARKAISKVLSPSEEDAKTLEVLTEESEQRRTTTQQVIAELLESGAVANKGLGKKGSPNKYYLTEIIPPEPPVVAAERNGGSEGEPPENSAEIIPPLLGIVVPAESFSEDSQGSESTLALSDSPDGENENIHSAGTTYSISGRKKKEDSLEF